ncbi:MAG: glycoside hydrolase family 3 C-terminal domain-containing protein [Erysipelotrichaceae bacterium]|nr:glycoside hydrolase family 3 C-terminal domain-containing protein [Erysipelotrichaceae bacterium]
MDNSYQQKHIDMLRPYLGECCVLLKSDGSFPLDKPCRIACFGSGIRNTVKGGTGSGEVNSRYFVTVEEGLEKAGFTITNPDWSDRFVPFREKAKEDFRNEIKRKAREQKTNVIVASMGSVMKQPEYQIDLDFSAEAAIYAVSRISGEGNDRTDEKGDFRLTDSEIRDILILDQKYERFMLVINAGGPLDLTPVISVRNILVLSQLGVETGSALADILLGIQNPSGRLTTSWACYDDYCHIGDFGKKDDTKYREGIYVGYRYFDVADKKPLFPFGYGLSYTSFETQVKSIKQNNGVFTITVSVTNTGKREGKSTVQIYLSAPWGKLDSEAKSLAGFGKTKSLKPQESDELNITFDLTGFASYDEDNSCYVLENGKYILLIGENSESVTPIGVYELDKDFTVRKIRNLFGRTGFEDYRPEKRTEYDISGLKIEKLDLSRLKTETVSYGMSVEIPEELKELSDQQLAYLNIGAFDPKGGLLSVIGDASSNVPGAAGESTSLLKDKGIGNLVMADGPAGLRLAREYYIDKNGKHAIGSVIPESIMDVLPKFIGRFINRKPKLKKGARLFEQFTTALPIATAIAQSWNLDLAEMCGDIVGSEMEIFNVDLWLAPALNIHRNVLCGRNFEYFSEDPLLSGEFASALTHGVQAHKGKGVTIKHLAANNQETNRYANNSVVSERALREIYLKGFEICIRESAPLSVMTSYNLINGIHTSESFELTENILRDEFGFGGLVMTDWVVASGFLLQDPKYPAPDAAKVAAAGCSLFMPGSRHDYKQIIEGLKRGTVTRQQLQRNSYWLLKVLEITKGSEND